GVRAGLWGSCTWSRASGAHCAALVAEMRHRTAPHRTLARDVDAGATDRLDELAGGVLQEPHRRRVVAATRRCFRLRAQLARPLGGGCNRGLARRAAAVEEHAQQHLMGVVAVNLVTVFVLLGLEAERTHQ